MGVLQKHSVFYICWGIDILATLSISPQYEPNHGSVMVLYSVVVVVVVVWYKSVVVVIVVMGSDTVKSGLIKRK